MSMLYRFRNLPPTEQLIALTIALDPVGFAGGYLLGPSAGFDPFVGGAIGLGVTSTITMLWFTLSQT